MEEDDPLILGELEVKLNEITLVESSLDTGEGVFRKKTAVASVSDDQGFLGHISFE
jgi:hypothetical protein